MHVLAKLLDIARRLGAAPAVRWFALPTAFGLAAVAIYTLAVSTVFERGPLDIECIGAFTVAFAAVVAIRCGKALLARKNTGEGWRDPDTFS